jgi:PST family polysaccharide transporter
MIAPDLADPNLPSAPRRARAAHNIFWLIAERALKAVGGVGMGILIARHLGPEHYGCYGAAIGLATLSKEAVMLGFDRMIRRDLAARPADAGKIIATSITLGLILALAVALGLSALAGWLVDDEETRRLTLIVVWMALPQAFFSCEVWFESSGQARPLVRTRNAVWSVAIIGRLALVLFGAHVAAFAILALAEWVATYASVCALLRRVHHDKFQFIFDLLQLKAWFREGWPMVLMVVVGSTADRIMVLVVHNLAATDAEAGYLNAALRIAEIWWSMSTIVAAVLLPRIVSLQLTDPERCARATQLYANASLLVGTTAAVAVTFTAPFLVPWLFGTAYAPSAFILVIIFWAGPAVFPSAARAQFWVSRGRLVLDLPTVVCTAVVQICLAVLLVPRHGAIGAATAMVSAQWLGFYGMTLAVPALRRASGPQFAAFRALRSPVTTFRSLYAFFEGMLKRA